jgi:hypothetical protein
MMEHFPKEMPKKISCQENSPYSNPLTVNDCRLENGNNMVRISLVFVNTSDSRFRALN